MTEGGNFLLEKHERQSVRDRGMDIRDLLLVVEIGQGEKVFALDFIDGHAVETTQLMTQTSGESLSDLEPVHARLTGRDLLQSLIKLSQVLLGLLVVDDRVSLEFGSSQGLEVDRSRRQLVRQVQVQHIDVEDLDEVQTQTASEAPSEGESYVLEACFSDGTIYPMARRVVVEEEVSEDVGRVFEHDARWIPMLRNTLKLQRVKRWWKKGGEIMGEGFGCSVSVGWQ